MQINNRTCAYGYQYVKDDMKLIHNNIKNGKSDIERNTLYITRLTSVRYPTLLAES